MNNFILFRVIGKMSRYFQWKKHLKFYDKSTWYFVLKYGIGDAYIVSCLLKNFKQKNENFVLIFEKDYQVNIPKLFFEGNVSYVDKNIPYELIKEFGKQTKGVPIILHPFEMNNQITQLIGYKNFTLMDIYKVLLNIDVTYNPENITLPITESPLTLYQNKILLCPEANSINTLRIDFWMELAKRIKLKGYTPIFLKSNYDSEFESIDFEINMSISICNRFSGVISLRSGFCDLISTSTTKKIILYPNVQWFSSKLINSTSLINMGLCTNDNNILELELLENKIEDVYKEIIEFI